MSSISKVLLKKYGEAYFGGEPPILERLSTGIPNLDFVLGGGLAKGRIHEIYGSPSCGKTTTCVKTIANLTNQGIPCAYIDLERTLDKERLEQLNVNTEYFHYVRPSGGEKAISFAIDAAVEGVQLIIIDSVAFLTNKKSTEGEIGDIVIAPQARLLSASQDKIIPAIEKNNAILIFINQLRVNIGGYGPKNDTPGGLALKFMCSIRIQINRKGSLPDKSGDLMTYTTTKNKTHTVGLSSEYVMYFDERNICPFVGLKSVLEDIGLVTRAGSYYKFAPKLVQDLGLPETLGQGGDKVIEVLKSDPNLYTKLYQYILTNGNSLDINHIINTDVID